MEPVLNWLLIKSYWAKSVLSLGLWLEIVIIRPPAKTGFKVTPGNRGQVELLHRRAGHALTNCADCNCSAGRALVSQFCKQFFLFRKKGMIAASWRLKISYSWLDSCVTLLAIYEILTYPRLPKESRSFFSWIYFSINSLNCFPRENSNRRGNAVYNDFHRAVFPTLFYGYPFKLSLFEIY